MQTRPPLTQPVRRPPTGGRPDDQTKVGRLGAVAVDHVDEDWPWDEVEDYFNDEHNTHDIDEEKIRAGMEKEMKANASNLKVDEGTKRKVAKYLEDFFKKNTDMFRDNQHALP